VGEASSPARIPVGNTPSLNLGRVAEMGAPMVSIGGAGTFAVPVLLPPLLAADVALVLAFRQAPPVAYIAGTMGALIGADLLRCQRPGTTWAISDSPPARPRRKLSGARCRIASPPAWNHALCQAVLGVYARAVLAWSIWVRRVSLVDARWSGDVESAVYSNDLPRDP